MAKKKSGKKQRGAIAYPLRFKLESLKLLHINDYNYNGTAKQVKVATTTLRRWERMLGEKIKTADIAGDIAADVVANASNRNEALLDTVFDVKDLILTRMKQLVTQERNLDNLQKTLKTLAEIDGTLRSTDGDDKSKGTTITIYEQINNILTDQNYESKTPITIDGDQAQPA